MIAISTQPHMLTFLMLETEYFGFGGHSHAFWCPDSQSRQSISRHGIGCVGSRVNFIYLGRAKFKIRFKYEYIFCTSKPIQHVKS